MMTGKDGTLDQGMGMTGGRGHGTEGGGLKCLWDWSYPQVWAASTRPEKFQISLFSLVKETVKMKKR